MAAQSELGELPPAHVSLSALKLGTNTGHRLGARHDWIANVLGRVAYPRDVRRCDETFASIRVIPPFSTFGDILY